MSHHSRQTSNLNRSLAHQGGSPMLFYANDIVNYNRDLGVSAGIASVDKFNSSIFDNIKGLNQLYKKRPPPGFVNEFSLSKKVLAGVREALQQKARESYLLPSNHFGVNFRNQSSLSDTQINTIAKDQILIMFSALAHELRGQSQKSIQITDGWRFRGLIAQKISECVPYPNTRSHELEANIYTQLLKKNVREKMSGKWGRIICDSTIKLHIKIGLQPLTDLEDLPYQSEIVEF